jgi:hypothetical protein
MLDANLQFCMDYEYWLRVAMLGAEFAYLHRILAGSRLYAQTKTLGSRVSVHHEINEMMRKRLGRVPDRWIFNYAHAVVEAKGFRRAEPLPFALAVFAAALYASLRWNRRVSRCIIQMAARWISGNARAAFKGAFTR